jgi:hypothetical protein
VARGPGTWQIDLGAAKHISFSERNELEFRAEFFNIFNHPQFGQPQADFSAGPRVFGSIITTANTSPVGTGIPRQRQFMLRLKF